MTIVDPSGDTLRIPGWMLSVEAARHSVKEEAQIGARALVELAYLVETFAPEVSRSGGCATLSPPDSRPAKEVEHEADRVRVSSQPVERASGTTRRKKAGGAGETYGRRNHGDSHGESGGKR